MNLKQKAIKGVFWSATQSWGSQAISFLVFALLARLLAPETFGLIALAGVFLAFIEVFLDQGFSTAIIQRQKLEPEHLDTAFWTNLAIGILMTGASISAADLIADFYRQPELAPIIRWLSISFVLRALSAVQEAIFTRNLDFKTLAIRSLIAVIAGGIVGVSMAFMGFGVWSLVGQRLSSSIVQITVLWWASDWRPKFRFSEKHFLELFSFGISVIGINLLEFFNRRSDDFLIGYFLGTVALGYYSIAYRVLLVMIQLLNSVTSRVALPSFSELQQEPKKMRNAFYKVTQLTSLISFPAFMGVAVLSPEIVKCLFGEQWLASVPVMQILAFVGLLHSVYYFHSTVIISMGKPLWKLKLNFISSVINILVFTLVVHWGIVAVAAAYTIRGYLFAPFYDLLVYKLIRVNLSKYFNHYLSSLLGTLAMVFSIFMAKYILQNLFSLPILLSIFILVGIGVYALTILFLEPILIKQTLDSVMLTVTNKAKGKQL